MQLWELPFEFIVVILGLQLISWDMADNVNYPRRLDPTMKLITYSFVLYLQHGRHDVKCKPSINAKFQACIIVMGNHAKCFKISKLVQHTPPYCPK